MKSPIVFSHRLGPDPHENGNQSVACDGCPDVWMLQDGDFAIIGITITEEARAVLPPSANCGPDESIVRVPREILMRAKKDIPDFL